MPLHEAAHGNIWGRTRRGRSGEQLVGRLCAIPLAATSFASHQTLHMPPPRLYERTRPRPRRMGGADASVPAGSDRDLPRSAPPVPARPAHPTSPALARRGRGSRRQGCPCRGQRCLRNRADSMVSGGRLLAVPCGNGPASPFSDRAVQSESGFLPAGQLWLNHGAAGCMLALLRSNASYRLSARGHDPIQQLVVRSARSVRCQGASNAATKPEFHTCGRDEPIASDHRARSGSRDGSGHS